MTAAEFLASFRPDGPWNLVAIHPKTGKVEGITFVKIEAAERWVSARDGEWNLYYTVNSLIEPINKKPKREDIKSMDWLHVDIDAREDETLEQGLARIRDIKPDGVPAPTFVIFSGGGYQLLWRLYEPFVIDGKEDRYEEAKLYNVKLEQLYGGDHCHNVDRIMRLPGTLNIPTRKKLQKHPGRKPVRAEVIR